MSDGDSLQDAISARQSRTIADEQNAVSLLSEPSVDLDDGTQSDPMRELLDISFIGTAIVNASVEIAYINSAMLSMFEIENLEEFRRRVNELICDAARTQLSNRIEQARVGTSQPSVLKLSATTGTGRAMVLQAHLHRVVWRRENAFCLMVTDITEDQMVSERVHHLEKMNALGELSGGIAHDLNNLLTVVLTNLELIRTDVQTMGDDMSACIEDAQSAARDSADLTGRLLSFSRRVFTASRDIEVAPFVAQTSAMLRRTLGEHIDVRIDIDSTADLVCRVEGDQFRTSLINLALNARDAMPDGGHLTIAVETLHIGPVNVPRFPELSIGDYLKLSMRDTGVGMSPGVVKRSVEPFFTTKSDGKGTGLGLSSVYGFARRCQGALRLESAPGEGTTATLFLPLAERLESSEIVESDELARIDDAPLHGSETILVVEDEPKLRSAVIRALKEYGYQVLQAEDAQAAQREISTRDDVDLVFSDIIMPGGMTGYELCRSLAETKPETRVALTTGYSLDMERIRESGEIPVLEKPYQIATLLKFIREVLDAD